MFEDAALFALSTQLEIGRWEDHVRRMDDRRHANAMNAVYQQNQQNLIARLNNLVQKYNDLLTDAQQYEQRATDCMDQQKQRIAKLEQELAELKAAKAVSDRKVRNYSLELAWRKMNGSTAEFRLPRDYSQDTE